MSTETASKAYREIPLGQGACASCDRVLNLRRDGTLCTHGPRGGRCPGSGERPVPWVHASGLPAWGEMSELDQGAALMHVWKRYWEQSATYARENYPARYFDHPALLALSTREACRHAQAVTGGWIKIQEKLGLDEAQRIYDAALLATEGTR